MQKIKYVVTSMQKTNYFNLTGFSYTHILGVIELEPWRYCGNVIFGKTGTWVQLLIVNLENKFLATKFIGKIMSSSYFIRDLEDKII